ncbi:unnamed protein product [Peniophora sp. CBMAI 1063]|nr:unnamed protein product [Peniophora sp. CBMAI 1063]
MSTLSRDEQHWQAARTAWSSLVDARFDSQRGSADPTTLAASLHEADIELQVIQECLMLARRRRNAMARVCRLPFELLSRIFSYLQVAWKPARWKLTEDALDKWEARNGAIFRYASGWMAVTHVCSTWRQVAVNDSSLWCDIECQHIHPNYLSTILARSKGQMLTLASYLHADPGDENDQGSEINLRRPTSARIKNLDLTVIEWDTENSFVDAPLSTELSNLSQLRLAFIDSQDPPPADVLTATYPSKLRRLDITNYIPPLASTLLSNSLWLLKLRKPAGSPPAQTLTVSHLSHILPQLPKLRFLGLENILTMGTEDRALRPFSVPSSLKVLAVVSSAHEAVTSLVGRATLPPSTSVLVDLHSCPAPDAAVQISVDLFREARLDHNRAREMMLKDSCMRLCPWTSFSSGKLIAECLPFGSPFTIDSTRGAGYRDLQVTDAPRTQDILLEDMEATTAENIKLYLPHLPLSSVTAIAFLSTFDYVTSPDSWITHFSPARNVTHIFVVASQRVTSHYAGLCAALEVSDGQGFALFPRLETITIGHGMVPFGERIRPHPGLAALARTLESRRLGGSPIQEVRTSQSSQSMGDEWDVIRGLVKLSFVP